MARILIAAILLVCSFTVQAAETVHIFAVPYVAGSSTIFSTFRVGQEFDVVIYARDLRPEGTWTNDDGKVYPLERGVFACYCDLSFDSTIAKFTGSVKFSEDYPNDMVFSVRGSSLINDTGAFSKSMKGTGVGAVEIFRVRMRAAKPGLVHFVPSTTNLERPARDTLVFGNDKAIPKEESKVPPSDVRINPCNVTIVK